MNTINKRSTYCFSLSLVTLAACFCATINAAVLVKDKRWTNHTQLNVVFLDGSDAVQQKVKTIAPQWLQKTGLAFRFYVGLASAPKKTHIRISFKQNNGSQLGNHQDYLSHYPTMNLSRLNSDRISQRSVKRLILHEFGHALGFEHEYLSHYWPYEQIPLVKILNDCYPKMEAIGYSKAEASTRCQQINQTLNQQTTLQTAYDEASIMNYPMQWIQSNGNKKVILASYQLSYLDHYAMQLWYPENPKP